MSSKGRIAKVRDFLVKRGIDAIIVDNPLNIFYLTGMELSLGTLIVTKRSARLVVDSRYYESCKKECPIPLIALEKGWLTKLLLDKSKNFSSISSIAFDGENCSYEKYLSYKKIVREVKRVSGRKSPLRLISLSNPIRMIRAIKEPCEIDALKRAAELGSIGYDFVCTKLKSGITEVEVARELDIFWKRRGSKGVAFDSIIAFGKNSSMPHYKPSETPLKKGDPVLIDIGVNLGHYHSDMTRVPFFGSPSPTLEEIYRVTLEAQESAIALCKPGIPLSEIDAAARKVIAEAGYEKNFTHSLGHGIGLEVHEEPFFRKDKDLELQEGMVITIEPGIYLPDCGGVRIEDTLLIVRGGSENLTNRPKELKIL